MTAPLQRSVQRSDTQCLTETTAQVERSHLEALFMVPPSRLERLTCGLGKLNHEKTEPDTEEIPHTNALSAPSLRDSRRHSTPHSCNDQCNGTTHGYIELAWIVGDPDDREHCQFQREFRAWPAEEATIRSRIASLAKTVGNVYVSAQLYEAKSRNSRVLPGRVVFVDDAPLDLECSFSVQTSPSSKHAYFVLDQDVPAETLRELARRAAYALGGDKGGWDSQQLVRAPGTHNTKAKHGGQFQVTLRRESGQRYTVERLSALWPILQAPRAMQTSTLNWPAVEQWLGNLSALIGDNGMPRRFTNPKGQSFQALAGVVTGDSSLDRYIVARGLVMHGYPDDEAAALLSHYCEYDKSVVKSSAWVQADVERILGKVRAEMPNIQPNPTRYQATAPARPLPTIERAKRGRRVTLTPDKLLTFYQAEAGKGDMVMLTVAEVADQLGVSRPTVERCERVLKGRGAIERRLFNRRQSSCVAVLRPITNTNQASNTPADHVPSQDPNLPQQNAESRIQAVHGETHPPEGAPPVALGPALPTPQAPNAVTEGVALAGVCFSLSASESLPKPRKRTRQPKEASFNPNARRPLPKAGPERTMEQRRRRLDKLFTLEADDLVRQWHKHTGMLASQRFSGAQRAVFQQRRDEFEQVMRRRGISVPDRRASTGDAEIDELWSLVDSDRARRPLPQVVAVAVRPAQPSPVSGLIERLRARKAASP